MPGLGQAYLGRPRRGFAFFAIVVTTLLAGLVLDRRPTAATAEAGTAFLLTAALMQLLLLLDTFDRATGRKG